jgi:hypothetical protein
VKSPAKHGGGSWLAKTCPGRSRSHGFGTAFYCHKQGAHTGERYRDDGGGGLQTRDGGSEVHPRPGCAPGRTSQPVSTGVFYGSPLFGTTCGGGGRLIGGATGGSDGVAAGVAIGGATGGSDGVAVGVAIGGATEGSDGVSFGVTAGGSDAVSGAVASGRSFGATIRMRFGSGTFSFG